MLQWELIFLIIRLYPTSVYKYNHLIRTCIIRIPDALNFFARFLCKTVRRVALSFQVDMLVSALLTTFGLNRKLKKGGALALLISGQISDMPAMAAAWGLVKRTTFALYLILGFPGSLIAGLLCRLV